MGLKNVAVDFYSEEEDSPKGSNRSCDVTQQRKSNYEVDDFCNNRSFVLYEKLKYAKNSKLMY